MIPRLGLIDYGMGNLHSVQKAFQRLDQKLQIVRNPNDLKNIEALILPGVGNFKRGMSNLRENKLIEPLNNAVHD